MAYSEKNQSETYDNIELCYKVMGLSFSDPPDQVDRIYHSLVDKYKRDMSSSDPDARQNAKTNLDQVNELFERITNSMIYKDYAREYEKYKQFKADEAEARKQKHEAEKDVLMICPYCSKRIPIKQRTCIYCHGTIYTPAELLLKKLLAPKVLIAGAVFFVLIAVAVVVLNPSLLGSVHK